MAMMRAGGRPLRAGMSLLLLAAVGAVTPAHGPAADAPLWLPPEVPRDAPSPVRPQLDPLARSPGMRAVRGPWVSIQVNVDAAGNNIVGDAANEPSIAVVLNDPARMAIGWRQFDSVLSDFRQAGRAYSTDAGATWTFPGVLTPGTFRSDPVLASDRNGILYYQSLRASFDMDVFRSADGGVTWEAPVPSWGGDKNWLAVDTSGGIGDGHVYGIWQRFFGCCGSNDFTRSVDGARSFEAPVSTAYHPVFGTMVVGPDGTVWATGADGRFFQDLSRIVVTRSTDARDATALPTFRGTVVDLGGAMRFGSPDSPNPAGLLGQANVAVDTGTGPMRGNVYVLASADPPGADPLDVHLVRSEDGGLSWSAPVRINDDPPAAGVYQWFGALAVAPNGRIDVIWADNRASGLANVSELYYAWSWDGGRSWSKNTPVSPAFDSHLGWPRQDKIGDYYTLVSDDLGAHVAWAATFNGEQDVYYLNVFPDCNGNGVADGTDIDTGTSPDSNADHVPDECQLLVSAPVPGQAGVTNEVTVSLAAPGSTVALVGGLDAGLTSIPGCDASLRIADPRVLGQGIAGADGSVVIGFFVPGGLAGGSGLYQAVEWPSCVLSTVETASF